MHKHFNKFSLRFLISGLLLFSAFSVFAQTENRKSAKVITQTLESKLMARPMPYNLLLPENYSGDSQKAMRYPVIYLLHGLTGHYNNWAELSKIEQYAADYNYIIVMPEGNDGWYTDSASVPNDKYESYIIKELIPEIDKKYRTRAERKSRAIAGLSMGGYGSLKFGLKYPDMFALAGSFSGALGITDITDKNSDAWISKSVMSVYGAPDSETRTSNDLFRLARELTPEKIKGLPFIYLDCGNQDFLIKNNRDFVMILADKKIPHEYRQLPGAHDWKYWDSQVLEFLRVSEKFIID